MIEIPLTKGFVALIDDEDYDLVSQKKWCVMVTKTGRQYAYRTEFRTALYMHTFITGFKYVDHINHNGLDNRRENLRESNPSLNHANIPKRSGTSQYKGVYLEGCSKRWIAKIRQHNKSFFLGRFDSELEAAKAYDTEALKRFGEHALINFKQERTTD